MKQFINTLLNCTTLYSFKYWKLLYNEFPHRIYRQFSDKSSFRIAREDIFIIINYSNSIEAALLHEIGHYISFSKIKGRNLAEKKFKYFNRDNISEEKTAWKYALKLSKKYNIPFCHKTAKTWLSTYGAEYAVLNNICKGV